MKRIMGILMFLTVLFYLSGCANKSETEYKAKSKLSVERIMNDTVSVSNGKTINSNVPLPPPIIQTSNGTLVYKVDSVLTIGVVSRVEARIIKKIGQSTTDQLVQMTTHTTTGVIKTETIKVGDIMDMDLVALQSNNFEINKISSGDQSVDESTVTEWLWGVTALKTGDYNLILKAKVKENGSTRDKIVFDKQINVINKPKNFYNMKIDVPEKLVKYVDNTLSIDLFERQGDTYFVEWGGNGRLELEFIGLNPGEIVKITKDEDTDYTINDNKSLFTYKWVIKPEKLDLNRDSLHYVVTIIGDYEKVVVTDRTVKLDKNWKGGFNEFVDNTGKRWYWVFTTLLIPLYLWIRKKYFPVNKVTLRRKRKKPTPKP